MRAVYLLSPKELSPEVIAVAFAKTSRSPESFREIAAELTEAASAQFHEKWVVGYGHASVAEHAVLHLALENVSRLAIETIESNRLASYTEKSTRYQVWPAEAFFTPPELAHSTAYRDACQHLFAEYHRALHALRPLMQARYPRKDGESEARWDARIRARYVDNARFLLPASALANVGMTANARVLESAIRKMLSHPLAEVRAIGADIKRVAQAEVPTLVKYADAVPYQRDTAAGLTARAASLPAAEPTGARVSLHYAPADGENRVLAACLHRFGEAAYADCLAHVEAMTDEQKMALAREALGRLDKYDVPLRELEHTAITCEVVCDQGGYFELKRHRMMTQTPQALTTRLGYAVPRDLDEVGLGPAYRQAMHSAAQAYETLYAEAPHAASYVVPNAFNRRVLMTLNLREAFHLIELRTAPNAHFSVRHTAAQLLAVLRRAYPALTAFMRVADRPTAEAVAGEHFSVV